MANVIYTAQATVTGGRTHGHGVTSDGVLDLQLRQPVETGGEGGGTNPEQLFAIGFGACFEGALAVVARRERTQLGEVSIDSRVSLVATEQRIFTVAVSLDVTLPAIDNAGRARERSSPRHTRSAPTRMPRGGTSRSS
jgi:Ohr subfamily peroxiredoxin